MACVHSQVVILEVIWHVRQMWVSAKQRAQTAHELRVQNVLPHTKVRVLSTLNEQLSSSLVTASTDAHRQHVASHYDQQVLNVPVNLTPGYGCPGPHVHT